MTSLEQSRKIYSVRVTQQDDLLPNIESEPSNGLFIIFSAFEITAYKFPEEDRYYYNPRRYITDERFIVAPGKLLDELTDMFHTVNVPLDCEDSIQQQIESIARKSASKKRFLILVEIKAMELKEITDSNNIGSDSTSVIIPREGLNGEEKDVIPASKSSIEKLERVRAEEIDTSEDCICAICLDEFLVKGEVIRMPCSHTYHRSCIFPWLEKSNLCPMCRYEMPVDENLK